MLRLFNRTDQGFWEKPGTRRTRPRITSRLLHLPTEDDLMTSASDRAVQAEAARKHSHAAAAYVEAAAEHLEAVAGSGAAAQELKKAAKQLEAAADKAKRSPKMSARVAFQKLWAAGTMGAFFGALVKNLPLHLSQNKLLDDPAADPTYTAELFIRYGYIMLFLGYFFMTTWKNEWEADKKEDGVPGRRDLIFDVCQSIASLTALYFLGFVGSVKDLKEGAYIAANAAMLVICGLSLLLFGTGWFATSSKKLNRLRWFGASVSFLGLVFALSLQFCGLFLSIMAGVVFFLLFVLIGYILNGVETSVGSTG